jgi:ribonuclease HII
VSDLPLFPNIGSPSEVAPLYYESLAFEAGYRRIAGVDEVGRGPLAGPVVAAAVIMPYGVLYPGIRDSKQVAEKAREDAFTLILENAVSVGIGVVSHQKVDAINILQASLLAMKKAVLCLTPAPDLCLVDGPFGAPMSIPQKCIIRGDAVSQSISAASIVAKVYRDRLMCAYHEQFPAYGFSEHKGYATRSHQAALRKHGPCPIHRVTFRGVCDDEGAIGSRERG